MLLNIKLMQPPECPGALQITVLCYTGKVCASACYKHQQAGPAACRLINNHGAVSPSRTVSRTRAAVRRSRSSSAVQAAARPVRSGSAQRGRTFLPRYRDSVAKRSQGEGAEAREPDSKTVRDQRQSEKERGLRRRKVGPAKGGKGRDGRDRMRWRAKRNFCGGDRDRAAKFVMMGALVGREALMPAWRGPRRAPIQTVRMRNR